jgi:hypothetical protein
VAVQWPGLALLASLVSVRLGVSLALVEAMDRTAARILPLKQAFDRSVRNQARRPRSPPLRQVAPTTVVTIQARLRHATGPRKEE